ncbi:hypothetical protein BDV93DRAFT_555257 [Ceratobasidium sp. AG-I]|nr:hypothetical protein BDV93DRAFT_555257 [Ceratobasidium sp. AG-I]
MSRRGVNGGIRQGSPLVEVSSLAEPPPSSSSFSGWLPSWVMPTTSSDPRPLRGVQKPVISSSPTVQPGHRTAFGIATPSGLEIWHSSSRCVAPHAEPKASEDTALGSKHSRQSLKNTPAINTYLSFSKDYKRVSKLLIERGFSKRSPPTSKQTLGEGVNDFITAKDPVYAPKGQYTQWTLFLVFSGHNSEARGRFVLKAADGTECSYSWARLLEAIKQIPSHIVVVIVLACCSAGDPVWTVADRLEAVANPQDTEKRPKLVILASSDPGQMSYASDRHGDHFLDALVKALQAHDLHRSYHDWHDFMALLMRNMDVNRQVHGAKWVKENPQTPLIYLHNGCQFTPFDIFRGLIKRPSTPTTRTITSATVQAERPPQIESSLPSRGVSDTPLE